MAPQAPWGFSLDAQTSTGALVYTNHNHVFTPTIAAGKGLGDFDIQATLGEAIPTHDNSKVARAILTNVTFQCHLDRVFWPELELNRTDWDGREGQSCPDLPDGRPDPRAFPDGRALKVHRRPGLFDGDLKGLRNVSSHAEVQPQLDPFASVNVQRKGIGPGCHAGSRTAWRLMATPNAGLPMSELPGADSG
jgi:hypothetical protein